MSTATIRLLVIKRFRSVRSLIWRPNPRLNIILGAADGGKSTVLEAIALLFSAAPPLQGWLDGKLTDLPDEDGAEPVLVCRLTGTPDHERQYEIIGAGGEIR